MVQGPSATQEMSKRLILFLSDMFASVVDVATSHYIQQHIDALKGQMTVVVIARRLSTIKNVDYVYVLDEGRVIEEGTYDELRYHDASRFREMVEMQSL